MSHRLTKEELDEQFEQFLKESVSDDSIDLGSSSKRSSVLDTLGQVTHKPAEKSKASRPWWQEDEDSEDTPGRGLLASGKTFRKSLRKSQPIQEEDEEQPKATDRGEEEEGERGAEQVLMSRDSLEPEESVMASGPAPDAAVMGLDTLNEEEEKARFFEHLEKGASSTIDYSRLNRELDSTESLMKAEDAGNEEERGRDRLQESRGSPASLNYSEDFEEEGSFREAQDKKSEGSAMLAKVSLHDSLDSLGGAQEAEASEHAQREEWPGPGEAETTGPAQSYGQSGVSEMEALQEAYRKISHSVGDVVDHEQSASLADNERDTSPFTPSLEHSKGTLKNTMTTGSDLPTAEELMRPIGPDSGFARGFALQPVSEAEPQPETKKPFPDPASPEAMTGDNQSMAAAPRESMEDTDKEYRRIREQVEHLMQYEEDLPPKHSPPQSKGKKQQVSEWSPVSWGQDAPPPTSWRKSSLPPAKSKRVTNRPPPPVTRTSVSSRTGPVARSSPIAQRKPVSQGPKSSPKPRSLAHGAKGVGSQTDAGLKVSSELIASVQSFADYLQQQIERTSGQEERCRDNSESDIREASSQDIPSMVSVVKPPGSVQREEQTEHRSSEHPLVDRLKMQLNQKEAELKAREEELLLAHGKEVIALKQENYILQSKLRGLEEANRKRRWSFGEASDPVTEEKLRLIEKEVKEQETLIQGYHQENEKLYQQVKALQAQSKQNEEAMFMENQRLLAELAATKEQISRINSVQRIVGNDSEPGPSCSAADLLAQVQALQKTEARLMEETRRLRQEKQALEVDLEMMKKERDQAKTQVIYTSGDKSFEIKLLEEKHREEVLALKKRLQWYAENQELLDKDAARLRLATEETQKLKQQVERLKMEVGKREGQQQQKAMKERASDAKRIQDLERQVREMEKILRRRHPNSLPALIFAAASAGGAGAESSQSVALLERRIRRLEAELEGKDEEAKRSLRAMEQQYHRIKMQYEERISELEQQLAQAAERDQAGSPQDWESRVQALQEELQLQRESHQERESALQAELRSLQERLQQGQSPAQGPGRERPQRSPTRQERQAEAAQASRIERLNQELAVKSRSVQELTRTVERLQRERRSMLSAPPPGERRPAGQGRGAPAGPGEKKGGRAEAFPPTLDEKDYQPSAFSGSHISEVLQESERLRARLEQLELEAEQERVTLRTAAAHAEGELRRTQERAEEQLSALRAQHQREVEALLARHALEHSSSKLAELTNQVSTQEIMIRHLRDQLKDLQGCKEALTLSQVREETLQNQMAKLLEDLKEAKEAHTPELRHFSALERKISSMELRYTQREKELQQVIAQTRMVVEEEQRREVERWKKLAQAKGQELEVFRVELDSILDILRELQRQGVVIPAPEGSGAPPLTEFTWRT